MTACRQKPTSPSSVQPETEEILKIRLRRWADFQAMLGVTSSHLFFANKASCLRRRVTIFHKPIMCELLDSRRSLRLETGLPTPNVINQPRESVDHKTGTNVHPVKTVYIRFISSRLTTCIRRSDQCTPRDFGPIACTPVELCRVALFTSPTWSLIMLHTLDSTPAIPPAIAGGRGDGVFTMGPAGVRRDVSLWSAIRSSCGTCYG